MGTISKDIIEDITFSRASTGAAQLSILIGVDSFEYMIYDPSGHIKVYREYFCKHFDPAKADTGLSELVDVLHSDKFLKKRFRQIEVSIDTPNFTIVPRHFLLVHEESLYLEKLGLKRSGEFVFFTEEVPCQDSMFLFAVPLKLSKILEDYLPGHHLSIIGERYINYYQKVISDQLSNFIHLYVRRGNIWLTLFENQRLVFSNRYQCQSAEDILYYTLLIFQHFKKNSSEDTLYISGRLVEKSNIYSLLYRYFSDIQWLNTPIGLMPGKKMSKEAVYFYSDMYCLHESDPSCG